MNVGNLFSGFSSSNGNQLVQNNKTLLIFSLIVVIIFGFGYGFSQTNVLGSSLQGSYGEFGEFGYNNPDRQENKERKKKDRKKRDRHRSNDRPDENNFYEQQGYEQQGGIIPDLFSTIMGGL